MEPQTTNGSSKLNTILLIVLILLASIIIWMLYTNSHQVVSDTAYNTPVGQTQTNQNPNGPDYQPNQTQSDTTTCTPNSPSTVKVISPNGGETFSAGQQVTVSWKSCNVTPGSIGIILIKHDSTRAYTQNEGSGDYAGFNLGGFNPYTGTADDGTQEITLPASSDSHLTPGQHYFFVVSGLGDATNIGSGYSPRDLSDSLFTIQNTQTSTVTLDMSSPYAQQYKTALTIALAQPADFDGHYKVANIGCGSGCFVFYVVDKNTGKVYKVPTGNDYGSYSPGENNWQPYTLGSNLIRTITQNGSQMNVYSFNGAEFTLISTNNPTIGAH